jgi:hypothetical protein
MRDGRLEGRLPPDTGVEQLTERAVAAGIIDRDEAATLVLQRQLVARVVRVDDFDSDLGASLLQPAIDAGGGAAPAPRARPSERSRATSEIA